MISQTIHDQLYEVYCWEEIGSYTFTLAKKILDAKLPIDRLVALARGGVSIAQATADYLGVRNISVVQMESYSKLGKTQEPIITQSLSVEIVGEHILLIDDLVDTGESFVFAKDYLQTHGPLTIHTAALTVKPWTKVTPDFSVLESKAWIIYPWETRETISNLLPIWRKKGMGDDKIRENLETLGFPQEAIERYWVS